MKLPFGRRKEEKKPPKEDSSVKYIFKKLSEAKLKTEEREVRSVVMGIGNDLKGDDGIGWYVVEKLKRSLGQRENIHFIKASVPENHVSEVGDFSPDVLIMIDSADFKGSPGDVRLIGESEVVHTIGGTHATPITLFIKLLLEKSESFAPKIVFVGIQKKQTGFGTPMSSEVRKAGNRTAELIERLYRGKILEESIEKETELLTTKNPLKRISKIVEKLAEAGRGKKE